jgi:signal transduction histidine kinase
MQDMVRAILAFVRGERPYLFSKSDLDTLLEEVAEDLRAAHGPDGVRVEREGSRVGHARVDPAAIRRLVDNLARNAAGAMPQGGRLAIASERAGDRWRLSVRDEGVGMAEGVRSRLFEPFFTQGKKGGTGLGLAIVKQIVDAHGGTIDVESAPGKGTTVRMEFPLEAPEPRAGT